MRWPFVSRTTVAALEAHLAFVQQAWAAECARTTRLEALLASRAQPEAAAPVAAPMTAATGPDLPPLLREEVAAIAGNERALSRLLTARAWALWTEAQRADDFPTLSRIRHQLRYDEVPPA